GERPLWRNLRGGYHRPFLARSASSASGCFRPCPVSCGYPKQSSVCRDRGHSASVAHRYLTVAALTLRRGTKGRFSSRGILARVLLAASRALCSPGYLPRELTLEA